MRHLVILMILVFVLVGSLAGCDHGRSKFDQVRLGMTKAEAVEILGEPQKRETTAQGGEQLRWRFGGKTVLLVLDKDTVTGRQLVVSGR